MSDTEASHPAAPTVPAELKSGDFVTLNGANVGIYSGICRLLLKNPSGGGSGIPMSLRRNYTHEILFVVDSNYLGEYLVVGDYDKDSPIDEADRSFGVTRISSAT